MLKAAWKQMTKPYEQAHQKTLDFSMETFKSRKAYTGVVQALKRLEIPAYTTIPS